MSPPVRDLLTEEFNYGVQESDDTLDTVIFERHDIAAFDYGFDAFGPQSPGEPQVLAVTVRSRGELECEFRKARLDVASRTQPSSNSRCRTDGSRSFQSRMYFSAMF